MLSARDIKAIRRYRGCHCRKPLALDISRLSLPPNCQTDSHVGLSQLFENNFGNNRCLHRSMVPARIRELFQPNRTSNFAKVNKVNSSNRSPVHVLSRKTWL